MPLSTSDVTEQVEIRMLGTKQGDLPPKTIPDFWNERMKNGNSKALHYKEDGVWKSYTWKEYKDNVDAFGMSLLSLGVKKFDIINIIGFNHPAWHISNFGAIAAGCVPAGIYTTNNAEACKYISDHSKAKVVVVEGVKQLEKYYEIAKDLPELKAIVMYGDNEKLPKDVASKCPVKVYTYSDFLTIGSKEDGYKTELKARSDSWKPGETCTLIYTSGTTGPPKAVMITQDNVTWTAQTMITTFPNGKMDQNDRVVSYLPLSHIAAQMLDMHGPLYTGCQVFFASPDALKGSIVETLKHARPTVFFGVPRVWEKIYEKLQVVAKSNTGLKKKLSTWAKSKAAAYWASQSFGSKTQPPGMLWLARKLLKKAHVALGLDKCQAFYVGAAPTEMKVLEYFASLDMPIMELFGQSECTGPHSVNMKSAFKLGTVGRPMRGTETRIIDGELCYRGRHIFAGYMGMPDKTKETIDEEGWMHSGDVVAIDDDNDPLIPKPSGFIKITGRIKELIITAGGENVPPVLIEEQLKLAMPAVANAMVIGDKRKFLTVLLCLHVEADEEGTPNNKLTGVALDTAKELGSSAVTTQEARDDPKWKEYFDKGVEKANAAATSRAQKVGKYALLDTDFSEKTGELTPTLKLKRNVAADIHSAVIEELYA